MADTKEANNDNDLQTHNEESTHVYDEKIYSYMKELSSLVVNARLKAREADIRSRYATEFANRAAVEAQLAHQVSGELARTSRMVAALALEFTNDFDECIDSFNDSRRVDHSSFLESDISLQSAGDGSVLSEGWSFDTVSSPDIHGDKFSAEVSMTATGSDQILPEPLTSYPEGIPKDLSSGDKCLSSVSFEKDSAADDKTRAPKYGTNTYQSLEEEIKNLEIKRKMRIYRDSKHTMSEPRRAEPLFPEEKSTQIVSNQPSEVACV